MKNRIGVYTLWLLLFCFLHAINVVAATKPAVPGYSLISADTIPTNNPDPVTKTPAQPPDVVIKQVPKSRRQMKPLVVPNINAVKPKRIIQPRITIKTGLLP